MDNNYFNFYMPVKVVFGAGVLNQLAHLKMPGKKALLVTTGGGSMKKYGYLEKATVLLASQNVDTVIFDKVSTNPTNEVVDEGAKCFLENECDFLVALGGGSPMDAAKGIAVVAANGGGVWDYIGAGSGGKKAIVDKPFPVVAIPTTSGTGSEVGAVAVISNQRTNEKYAIKNIFSYPALALIDPELTLHVPKRLTAFQAFDAFTHAAEGYLNTSHTAITDLYALEAVRLIARQLPKALDDGSDLDARTALAMASCFAGMPLSQAGVLSMHLLEHSISACCHTFPHGAGLALLFEAYFNKVLEKGTVNSRLIELTQAMGEPVEGCTTAEQAACFITAVKKLIERCDLQIDPTEFDGQALTPDMLTQNVMPLLPSMHLRDPFKLTEEDILEIYSSALRFFTP